MKIKIKKYCPCKIDRKIIHFKVGSFHDIDERNAKWMLELGYAIPQIKTNKKALKQALEDKVLEPTEEDKAIVQPKKRGRPKKDKEQQS